MWRRCRRACWLRHAADEEAGEGGVDATDLGLMRESSSFVFGLRMLPCSKARFEGLVCVGQGDGGEVDAVDAVWWAIFGRGAMVMVPVSQRSLRPADCVIRSVQV